MNSIRHLIFCGSVLIIAMLADLRLSVSNVDGGEVGVDGQEHAIRTAGPSPLQILQFFSWWSECVTEGCCDGTFPWQAGPPPRCDDGTARAVIDGSWRCIEEDTCELPVCDEGDHWDETLESCCPDAIWVVDCQCVEGSTYYEDPQYNEDGCLVGIGCGCELNGPCDDGTDVLCDMVPPACEDTQIVAVIDGCFECVDPDTCALDFCAVDDVWVPEIGECCPEAIWVQDCLCEAPYVSQPGIDIDEAGCVLGYTCGCEVHPCSEPSDAICEMVPPTCEGGTVLVVESDCWSCVDPDTCTVPGEEVEPESPVDAEEIDAAD